MSWKQNTHQIKRNLDITTKVFTVEINRELSFVKREIDCFDWRKPFVVKKILRLKKLFHY